MRICKETISFLGLLLCVAHLTAGTITPQSQILKSEVADVNNDKQPDIILLTAQNGKEQLEIYLGGKGQHIREKRILSRQFRTEPEAVI